jgi:hypothetical protein
MTDQTLTRLRAADPVSATTPAGAEALFDRIVLTAPDRRLDRAPRRRHRRPVVVLLTALLACALLTSAAYGISSLLGDIIGGPTVKSEYAAAQKHLTLPLGDTWPELHWPPNSVTSRGAGGSFAVAHAQVAWECYWAATIRSGDLAGQRRAKAALADLMANNVVIAPEGAPENWAPPQAADTPLEVFADDGGYQYKQRMYAEAAAGDPSRIAQSCKANSP